MMTKTRASLLAGLMLTAAVVGGCNSDEGVTSTNAGGSGGTANTGGHDTGGNNVGGVGAGDATPCDVSADLDSFITDTMALDNIPGLAAGIVTAEGLVWSKGYGMANIAGSTPVTDETYFALMSISKMVTAAGVMQVVEDGDLDLDADVNDYFASVVVPPNISFEINNPNAAGTVTLKHLLSHTSGIAGDDYGVLQLNIETSDAALQPLGEMLASLLHPDGARYDGGDNYSVNGPGSNFSYSSIGISVGAYAAEVVSGTGFDELTKANIFNRLGMTNTSWRLNDFDDKQDQLAVMYNLVGDTPEQLEAFTFAEYPAGSLRSNVPELARFLAAIINDGTYGNQQILTPQSVALMEEAPFPDATGGLGYGLGMFLATDDLRAHGGDDAGAATDMAYNRVSGKGVIVLSNVTRTIGNDEIYQRLLQEAENCE